MNPLHEAIKDKIVEPALKDRHHMTKGVVVSYNNTLNRATVEIDNRYGVGKRTLQGVPVQLGSGGVHSAGPFVGSEVWVTFIGGNVFYPRIVSIADSFDAMISERPYRKYNKSMSVNDALLEIMKNSGTQFDPMIAKIFVENANSYKW